MENNNIRDRLNEFNIHLTFVRESIKNSAPFKNL
jgi:hypothetical protein